MFTTTLIDFKIQSTTTNVQDNDNSKCYHSTLSAFPTYTGVSVVLDCSPGRDLQSPKKLPSLLFLLSTILQARTPAQSESDGYILGLEQLTERKILKNQNLSQEYWLCWLWVGGSLYFEITTFCFRDHHLLNWHWQSPPRTHPKSTTPSGSQYIYFAQTAELKHKSANGRI